MSFADTLRPPAPFDHTTPAYKDWLHLNIFDATSRAVGIFNVSLHGSPGEARSRAIGTALLYTHEQGWSGNVEVRGITESLLGPYFIGLAKMGIAVVPSPSSVMVSVNAMEELEAVRITATAVCRPVLVESPIPFGSGWISWRAVPLLRLEGRIEASGWSRELSKAWGYHDHNWGRWHWGDDMGWEWGSFVAGDGAASFVFARTTDRAHRRLGPAWLSVCIGDSIRRFSPGSIQCEVHLGTARCLRRFPGVLAALHQDRAEMTLPDVIVVRAADGFDSVEIVFHVQAAAQLIAADPVVAGYGFIHELPGEFEANGRLNNKPIRHAGMAIFEYVC